MAGPGSFRRPRWRMVWLIAVTVANSSWIAADPGKPPHDTTFRPSVIVRQGKSIGSGTIIASVEGETLVLTASHVVEGLSPITIELHRFNLGLEKTRSSAGFPRILKARIVVRDEDSDLAILRVKGEVALPFVAKLDQGQDSPPSGTEVLTIGFDKGERLVGFSTRTRAVERLDLGHGGGLRDFLVTEDPPEVGRSGGGLFRSDGRLVGVCVARAELEKGRKRGLFSPLGQVKALIDVDEDLGITLARSLRRPKPEDR